MADLKIDDLSISIAEAVQFAQRLATPAHAGRKGEDAAKPNFQRLGAGLELARDSLSYLEKELNTESKRRMLSTAALSSIYEILAGFDEVFLRRVEAVENVHDNGSIVSKDLDEFVASTLLAQLDKVQSRVLLMSAVILYAEQIQKGESESVRQRQQNEIRALLYGEITARDIVIPKPDAIDGPSPDLAQETGPPPRYQSDSTRITETRKKAGPIIVGVDFGATSSAVAFALAKSSKQEPKVLDGWPKFVQQTTDGVPREQQIQSTVFYNQYLRVVGWGEDEHEAAMPYMKHTGLGRLRYLRPGVQQVQDFKSGLAPLEDIYLFLPVGKSTADVAADYLWHLRQSACSQIEEQLDIESGGAQGSRHYVMSVPASWDEKAQKSLVEVAQRAGFWINSDVDEFALIPGPEAAVLHADSIDPSAFELGDNVLVVDSGCHLVESVTYLVKSKDPLRLERYSTTSVASCGSAEVIRRFMAIVESKIKKMGLSDHKLMRSRIRPKCKFYFQIQVLLELGSPHFPPADVPGGFWAVNLGWEVDFPEADFEDGYMMFSEEEIYSCFDPVVDRTLELIEEQVTAVRGQNKELKVRKNSAS